jgi:hypothetical protein
MDIPFSTQQSMVQHRLDSPDKESSSEQSSSSGRRLLFGSKKQFNESKAVWGNQNALKQ